MLTSLEWSFANRGEAKLDLADRRETQQRQARFHKQFMGSEFRVFRRLEGLGLGFTAYEVRVLASRFTGFSLSNDSPTYMLCQGPSRTRNCILVEPEDSMGCVGSLMPVVVAMQSHSGL